MRVVKYRGQKYRGGYHDITITTGGVKVFPRLIAAEHRKRLTRTRAVAPASTAFDRCSAAASSPARAPSFWGPPARESRSIAITFALAAIARGERAALFVFDEELGLLLDRMKGLGIDLEGAARRRALADPTDRCGGTFAGRVRAPRA